TTMSDLAGLYRIQKKYDKSEPLWLEALSGMKKALGPDHSETLILTNNIAALYRDMGKYAEAQAMADAAIAGARRTLPKDHWYLPTFLVTQGKLQTKTKQFDAAEVSLKEAYDSLNRSFGPDHPRTQDAIDALANLYEAWEKPAEAAQWRGLLKTES